LGRVERGAGPARPDPALRKERLLRMTIDYPITKLLNSCWLGACQFTG